MAANAGKVLGERIGLLEQLAGLLAERAIPYLQPVGAHAIYIVLDDIVGPDPLFARSFECLMYLRGGLRVMVNKNPHLGKTLLRLPITLGGLRSADLPTIAHTVQSCWNHPEEAPRLTSTSDEVRNPFFTHYALRG
jgi:tryptophanase